ncbi:hypothetical protein Kisp01_13610 [Kineosporia sp. NBRC 101677]|uniref:N,N-dimethylformamidase beta subunit family domain-containing protein n=1 Tax=Kineosporia sp. NBRC 101677 TaxID=3032197 RepID=UPI0024A410C2|nr:N,N-dimethylformamidase beta subunit family domain-containing protein [Kineosporia sp. NBRC 101677]GLY14345.1 hypothetical protein Kisp01_13610 [Kineosporia sp. NBRC 101677]
MPSPRLLAVTALVALGGLAGLISAGGAGSEAAPEARKPASDVRGGLVSNPGSEAGPIARENAQAGAEEWRIAPARAAAKGLAAYAGASSVAPGELVPVFLRGAGAAQVRAFRLGWYGGDGARQVWQGTLQAQAQSGPPAGWQSTGSLDTTNWPEGAYLVRLDLGKASRYLPLTVTSVPSQGSASDRVVVLTSPMTWAATNRNGSVGEGREVTLNRPLLTGAGAGALATEAGLIAQIERTGTDVVYLTDTDLTASPKLLEGATAVLVAGESRYWTPKLRGSVRAAVADGTDLAFFGAGSAGVTALPDQADARSFTVAAGSGAKLTGSVATCEAVGSTGLTITDPSWWGFGGAQVSSGQVLKGLVSGRLDQVQASAPAQVVGSADLACGDVQATSYVERPSGATVFNAGTAAWGCTVTGFCLDGQGKRVKADAQAQEIAALVTRNVVTTFAGP